MAAVFVTAGICRHCSCVKKMALDSAGGYKTWI